MSAPINFRRGVSTDRVITTLGAGEPGWDTTTKTLYVGDGTTVGGNKVGGAPISVDYEVYIATSTYGATVNGSGLALKSGVATGIFSYRLLDSGGGFSTTKHLNKTVYNSTNNTWTKITSVNSATDCSLLHDIFASYDAYVICDAVTTIQVGLNRIENPYNCNVTVRISDGIFSDNFDAVGLTPSGSYNITMRGSTSSTTNITGVSTFKQRINVRNCIFKNRINCTGGSNVTWTTCSTTGASGRLFIYDGAINVFDTCTIVLGNNPGAYTELSSTITKGYTMLVNATGTDAYAEACAVHAGSASSTTTNKLIDSTANFNSDVVNMKVWNSTDDTWATVNYRDSATQLTLSADIMVSGESYLVGNAFATIQKAVTAIPGSADCNTIIKVADGTYGETVNIRGKTLSGSYNIDIKGTLQPLVSNTVTSGTVGSGATRGTLTKVGAFTGVDYSGKLVYVNSTYRLIYSNTDDTLTIVATFVSTPSGAFSVLTWATNIDAASVRNNCISVASGQLGVRVFAVDMSNSLSHTCILSAYGELTGIYCRVRSITSWVGAWTSTSGRLSLDTCIVTTPTGTQYTRAVLGLGAAYISINRSLFHNTHDNSVFLASSSYCNCQSGTTIIHTGPVGNALHVDSNGVIADYSLASNGYIQLVNCTNGIEATSGGQVIGTVNVQFSGCTTNKNAAAGSYGYID